MITQLNAFDKPHIAKAVRETRKKMNLSQEKFAAMCGTTQGQISLLERGLAAHADLDRIARECNVTVEFLLGHPLDSTPAGETVQ